MKTLLLISLMAAIFAIPTQAQAQESMNSCKTKTDCIKVLTSCKGVMAINKKFRKEWSEQVDREKSLKSCQEFPQEVQEANKKLKPRCTKNICELI